ncbi:MAG: hypothetical protein HY222_01755 [Thaumarchaeota archaeon]|nr:hypothetical protein [Nitrososphaerota archaeon]MBI3641100.1 hypothetical protein [Nitrososphaerota archaeon]
MKFKRKKEEIITPYTVEQCDSCNAISKRKFKEGDYVFKKTYTCSSCKGQMSIIKIFGEVSA